MAETKELADYVLERRLGEGRVTEVFLAVRKHGVPEPLALKRLRLDAALDEGVTSIFLEEARRVAPLLHPNVAQVIDAGSLEGAAYVVEEHVEGPSLEGLTRALAARQELLAIEACVDVAVQLCRALHALHDEAGPVRAVHGGVSPWSVMVRREGALKLTDFGVERVVTRLTGMRAGVAEPRFGYYAPEALRGEDVDARADQHAVGVLLWELLTGRRLFHAPGAAARENVLTAPTPPPSSIRRSVPVALDEVVLRALARVREQRFESVAALEHALEALVPPLGVDDRESRTRAELERLFPSEASPLAPPVAFADVEGDALAVEHTVAVGEGDLAGAFDARAIPLEGVTRSASGRVRPRGKKKRSRAAALVVLALVGGVAFVAWRFSDELRAIPGVGQWLPASASTEAARPRQERAASPVVVDPAGKSPAVKKLARKRSPEDEAKADRLERRAAELLLAGETHKALAALREATDLSPERPSLHQKLAMSYRALGERYLAKRHLERYLALAPRASDRSRVEALLEELREE